MGKRRQNLSRIRNTAAFLISRTLHFCLAFPGEKQVFVCSVAGQDNISVSRTPLLYKHKDNVKHMHSESFRLPAITRSTAMHRANNVFPGSATPLCAHPCCTDPSRNRELLHSCSYQVTQLPR